MLWWIVGFSLVMFVVIGYPLLQGTQVFLETSEEQKEFDEPTSILSTLSELEEDYALGRLSESDYQKTKSYFQKHYLQLKQTSHEQPG